MECVGEIEDVLEIRPGVFEMKIKEKDEIDLAEDIKVEIVGVEYHDRKKKERPKTIVIKISAPSKYPIIRPERRNEDFHMWQTLPERSNKICSKTVRRFFYQKQERDVVEVGGYKLVILAFRDKSEAERLHDQGYLCKLRMVYPKRSL